MSRDSCKNIGSETAKIFTWPAMIGFPNGTIDLDHDRDLLGAQEICVSASAHCSAAHAGRTRSLRYHMPNHKISCSRVSGGGRTRQWMRSPMTGNKFECIHCGLHCSVPNRAAAMGTNPSVHSDRCAGIRPLAPQPKPCSSTGRSQLLFPCIPCKTPNTVSGWYITHPPKT